MADHFKENCVELETCLGSEEAGHLAAFLLLGLGELAKQLHERDLIDLERFEEMLAPGLVRQTLSPTWVKAFGVLQAHLHEAESGEAS